MTEEDLNFDLSAKKKKKKKKTPFDPDGGEGVEVGFVCLFSVQGSLVSPYINC